MDLVILADGSSNVPQSDFKKVVELIKHIYNSLLSSNPGSKAAVILISNAVKTIENFNERPSVIDTALNTQLKSGGSCPMGEGVRTVNGLFQAQGRPEVLRVLVNIMAGKSDDDVAEPAKQLKDAGVLVYTVGLGKSADQSMLSTVSSSPASEFVVEDPGFPATSSVAKAVVEKIKKGMFKIYSGVQLFQELERRGFNSCGFIKYSGHKIKEFYKNIIRVFSIS